MAGLERWHKLRVQAARKRQEVTTAAQVERSTVPVVVNRGGEPVFVDASIPALVQEGVRAGEEADFARGETGAALAAAAEAADLAASAQTTADGKNARRRGKTEPAPPPGGWVNDDQWIVDNEQGVPVEVRVWNGAAFVREQTLASEILVLSEDGTVRIGDGKVTAPMLSVGALDYKIAKGLEIQSGRVVGGTLELSDLVSRTVRFSDTCDAVTNWDSFPTAGQVARNTTNKKQGTASVQSNAGQNATLGGVIRRNGVTAADFNKVSAWLYSSHKATINVYFTQVDLKTEVAVESGIWTLVEIDLPAPASVSNDRLSFRIVGAVPAPGAYFLVDDIQVAKEVVSSTSGVKIGRTSTGVAFVQSTDASQTAQMQGGGMSIYSNNGLSGSASYGVEGVHKTGAGTPLVIGHDSAGADSPVRIYASGDNKIEMLSTVAFKGDTKQARLETAIPGATLGSGVIHGVNSLYNGLQASVQGGVLYISGRVERSGGIPANHVIFTLPPGFRVAAADPVYIYSGGHNFGVLQPNGECILALASTSYATISKMVIPLNV